MANQRLTSYSRYFKKYTNSELFLISNSNNQREKTNKRKNILTLSVLLLGPLSNGHQC